MSHWPYLGSTRPQSLVRMESPLRIRPILRAGEQAQHSLGCTAWPLNTGALVIGDVGNAHYHWCPLQLGCSLSWVSVRRAWDMVSGCRERTGCQSWRSCGWQRQCSQAPGDQRTVLPKEQFQCRTVHFRPGLHLHSHFLLLQTRGATGNAPDFRYTRVEPRDWRVWFLDHLCSLEENRVSEVVSPTWQSLESCLI